jgi:hypothetical protein
MSVTVMSKVFADFSWGGGPLILALSLADFASDDGQRIYPAVKTMAKKTRQSARTVQRQLRMLEKTGWLICVRRNGDGSRSPTHYRIDPEWIRDPANWRPKPGTEHLLEINPRQNDTGSDSTGKGDT